MQQSFQSLHLYQIFREMVLVVASCQPSVNANTQQVQRISQKPNNDFQQKVKNLAAQYPDLYRVDWTVCGVQKRVSIGRTLLNQCVDNQSTRPMFVWGATGAYKLIPTEQYIGGIQSHLFVESNGCFGLREPSSTAQYYKARTFLVGLLKQKEPLSKPTAQVKFTQLSDKEKEGAIAELITNPPETFSPIVTPDDCKSKQEWTSVYTPAIPPGYK